MQFSYSHYLYTQLMVINADNGLPKSNFNTRNLLLLIDPSEGPVQLDLSDQRHTLGTLGVVGLPEYAIGASSSGSGLEIDIQEEGWDAESGRAILDITANQSLPMLFYHGNNMNGFMENLQFQLPEGEPEESANAVIQQYSGEVTVVNCGSQGDATFVQQRAGELTVSQSDFVLTSDAPAIKSDRKLSISDSTFECQGECRHAIALLPYTPQCRPIKLKHLTAEGFPYTLSVKTRHNENHRQRVPLTVYALQITQDESEGVAIHLAGSLEVTFDKNDITGEGQVLEITGFLPPGESTKDLEQIGTDIANGQRVALYIRPTPYPQPTVEDNVNADMSLPSEESASSNSADSSTTMQGQIVSFQQTTRLSENILPISLLSTFMVWKALR